MSFTASGDRCCQPHYQEARLKAHLIIELQQPAIQHEFPHKNDVCITQSWNKKKKNKIGLQMFKCILSSVWSYLLLY